MCTIQDMPKTSKQLSKCSKLNLSVIYESTTKFKRMFPKFCFKICKLWTVLDCLVFLSIEFHNPGPEVRIDRSENIFFALWIL